MRGSRLRLYADATYQKSNVRKQRFQADMPIAGYRDGPLKRRANAGIDWTRKDLSIGANLQYFGSTLAFSWDPTFDPLNENTLRLQGSSRIPSQTYLDLYGTWQLPARNLGPIDEITLDFGIVNALDEAPPRVRYSFTSGPGYSRYADPRMRRFELGLSCRF
jgi:outer membrane receptor protein involved in Fe transport